MTQNDYAEFVRNKAEALYGDGSSAPRSDEAPIEGDLYHRLYVAGYRTALRAAADHFEKPRVLWSGDGGVQVMVDETRLAMIPIAQWLRERANAER